MKNWAEDSHEKPKENEWPEIAALDCDPDQVIAVKEKKRKEKHSFWIWENTE